MLALPFIDLPPLHWAGGTVRLPGSKSISNRVLLLAGLARGSTRIHGLLESDDTRVMLQALRQLGCGIDGPPQALQVTGLGGRLAPSAAPVALFLGNAGTAMRPLAAAVALLASDTGAPFELSGVDRMHERPIGDLVDALRALGARIDYLGTPGYPPLRIHAPGAGTTAGAVRVRGDVSSQFLTALLMALPLRPQPTVVEVEGDLISRPYVEITLKLLARFGVQVQRDGWQRFTVPGGNGYRSPGEIAVEGDASSASYFIGLGALAATVQPLRIEGVGTDSIQGDIRFVDAVRRMGGDVVGGPGWLEVRRGQWPLRALDLDCNDIPDAAMTLAVLALYAQGTTRLRNIASWRVKETDRLAALATELGKLGARVEQGDDELAVTPPERWRPAAIRTYDDHRVAMCFSLAACNPLAGARPGVPVRILDPKCVAKTFPDYFETLFGVVGAAAADIPVITVDGPSASGKGTLASELARRLGYHMLESGALYRATALSALRLDVPADDEAALGALAAAMQLRFDGGRTWLDGQEVTQALREEAVGALASRISAWPAVREALRGLQLSFRRVPGLVADGRDMGTVIFPDAALKVFLTASAATRARRRHKQLISQGIEAKLPDLLSDLEARDARDKSRSVAPCKPAEDAQLLDNSALDVDASVDVVMGWWQARRPFG